ncbi:MAG: hypothetical protein IKU45_06870, partial [Clostridia bacterium]|nr:hypothetical protein [Clostridia bacterium]
VNINDMEQHHLDKNDKRFIRSIWKRYPFAFQFLLKIYLKVSMYSAWEKAYSPKALLVCSEYSFTSSAMTAYCRQSGLKHIDVMHGEKLFYIRDSFFEFDRCYVWDNFYRDLFIRMRAEERQFTTEVPPSLCFSNHSVDKEVDFTFYLGAEGERDIRILAKHCRNLRGKGYRVAVRPHPRYTSKALLGLFPEDILIENNDTIPIEVSVLRTSNVVSLYSTVLNQALNNGINIVIDDLTDVRKYQELKCRDFICLNQPHRLLSEIVKDGATA